MFTALASSVPSLAHQSETELPSFHSVNSADAAPIPADSFQLEKKGVTLQFWDEQHAYSESIVAKLKEAGELDLALGLEKCGSEEIVQCCTRCSKRSLFRNHCDRLYCPLCQPRLSYKRRQAIEPWTLRIKQPKHLVLTTRNSDTLSRGTIAKFKKAFLALRRSKLAANWKGGTFALEVTNESRGWHLHSHSLIDARWIDERELAQKWAALVGQDFAIVKVKDAREKDYLSEITKYAVKGSMLSTWSSREIADFIRAFARTRTWAVFGSLWHELRDWRKAMSEIDEPPRTCDCGCSNLLYLSPSAADARDLIPPHTPVILPPPPSGHLPLPPPSNYDTRS